MASLHSDDPDTIMAEIAEDRAKMEALGITMGDDGESVARTIQQIYLGVGKVITIEEAREIVNKSGGNLPDGLPAELKPPSPIDDDDMEEGEDEPTPNETT